MRFLVDILLYYDLLSRATKEVATFLYMHVYFIRYIGVKQVLSKNVCLASKTEKYLCLASTQLKTSICAPSFFVPGLVK